MTYAQSLFVVTANGFAVVFVFDQGYPTRKKFKTT